MKRSSALLLLSLLAACDGRNRRLAEAADLQLQNRPEEAMRIYKDLLSQIDDSRMPGAMDARIRALKGAGDLSYLDLGDYEGAVVYYRRLITYLRSEKDLADTRAKIGDILLYRLNDPQGAIAQYGAIASGNSEFAPAFQLKAAKTYLAIGDTQQARTEARILRDRWPNRDEADEAQMLTVQAWSLDRNRNAALGALRALIERNPKKELLLQALIEEARLEAAGGDYGSAIETLKRAGELSNGSPEVLAEIEILSKRKAATQMAVPGDREQAFKKSPPSRARHR